jgi:hypothetical protein
MKSPDKICQEYSDKKARITVKKLDDETILIEGNQEELELLGNLIIAQAQFKEDCGFHLHPNGAGSALFSKKSSIGLYIHRLPCDHGEIDEKK